MGIQLMYKKFQPNSRPVDIEKVLKALANKRRLQIISLLLQNKRLSVAKISESMNLSYKSTSKHLQTLSNVKIVEREQESLQVYYSILYDKKNKLGKFIDLIFRD